jgi:uncharacterized protein
MMRNDMIVSTGKSVHEAIETGLKLMQATLQEVDIEILEPASRGFFGLFQRKPAVVKVTRKQTVNQREESESSSQEDILLQAIESSLEKASAADKLPVIQAANADPSPLKRRGEETDTNRETGLVWIKNGQIFCKEAPTHYPTITPKEGVILYKNGEVIRKTTVITERDIVKVELKHELKHTDWSIEIDESKMKAILRVEPGFKKICKLVDQEPSSHIHLEVEEIIEATNHLQPTHVVQKMQELGINTGIQKVEILKASEVLQPAVFEVAKGIEPQKGKDGWLELCVDTEWRVSGPKERKDGTVDFRDIKSIPRVEAGEVIAIIHPPQPGSPGVTVTGEPVPPEPVHEIVVQIGSGVDLIDGGRKIVALQSGRPHVEYRGKIARVQIMPKLVHPGDVNLASGNIHFLGDVEILGDVDQGMTVKAMSNIVIHGLANSANIVAGSQVIINKNVINSHVTVGKSTLSMARIGQLLKQIAEQLENVYGVIEHLYSTSAFKTSDVSTMGLSSVIRIMTEKRFQTLPVLVKEYKKVVEKAEQDLTLDDGYKQLDVDLTNSFIKLLPAQLKGPEDLLVLIRRVKEMHGYSVTPPEPNAVVSIPYAQNSEIYCSGDIYITGQGSINSRIHSEGKLYVDGSVRGGDIYAAMGAEIEEVGSRGAAPTRIRVAEGQTIKIKSVMEGTIIQIGNRSYQFFQSEQNVFARLNREGHLLLH